MQAPARNTLHTNTRWCDYSRITCRRYVYFDESGDGMCVGENISRRRCGITVGVNNPERRQVPPSGRRSPTERHAETDNDLLVNLVREHSGVIGDDVDATKGLIDFHFRDVNRHTRNPYTHASNRPNMFPTLRVSAPEKSVLPFTPGSPLAPHSLKDKFNSCGFRPFYLRLLKTMNGVVEYHEQHHDEERVRALPIHPI